MSNYPANSNTSNDPEYVLVNPLPKHFEQIQELCKRVYPFSKPWSIEQLESHRSYFPDGQLIVIEKNTGKIVGMAFSLIILWSDYSPQDNWQDFTSGGFFHNHNPKNGKTLYGAEVMVDPECRGRGIGKMLYAGRKEIVEKYHLKRIRAGARLRGYAKYQNKLTPDEYVKQVVQRNIFDPTLSFQLGQDFKVIDVAPNYLFNDPESLGYAAVIEWINPKENTHKEFEKQRRSIELFMNGERFVPKFLPRELRQLVRKTTSALGNAIQDLEGNDVFKKIEYYREQLKLIRNKQDDFDKLNVLKEKLSKESRETLFFLAHAFSLQLEIVNICESAYRTWRQRNKSWPHILKKKQNLTYVLTAHPTEARSKATIKTLNNILKILVDGTHNNLSLSNETLKTQMRLLWLQSLSKAKSPTVLDEAEYIYSLIFDTEMMDFILNDNPIYQLKLRTWVGGDKDGHPGVNKDIMRQCLNESRIQMIEYASKKFISIIEDLSILIESGKIKRNELNSLKTFYYSLQSLKTISNGDGSKVKTWSKKFKIYLSNSSPFLKDHSQILLLTRLLDVFPALVLPIELREDASLIKLSLNNKNEAIFEMLSELDKISGALKVSSYARGLIISHCESEDNITDACKLVDLTCKDPNLPVIPLFESREALKASSQILKNWLKVKKNHERVTRHWIKKFEIMLGYSDSSKQIGVLPSRILIAESMQKIEKTLKAQKIVPVFFHGSGGSVARGGGSLKEQISWWSASAIDNPKMTIQGEMIQRLFSSKEILNSQCTHFTTETIKRNTYKKKLILSNEITSFAHLVSEEYSKLVSDIPLIAKLLNATPYKYFNSLKLGSRPSKRSSEFASLSSLRAIPWILCWTQTRILWPAWWGVGTAWNKLTPNEKQSLKMQFKSDPFLSSFVKILGFTLSKVEPSVWRLYLTHELDQTLYSIFQKEYQNAILFVKEMSGENSLLWYRPWLEESIHLRSPHIHILNLLQIIAMDNADEALLRETIVGIACGMLTTG